MSKLPFPDLAIGWHAPGPQDDATPLTVLCLHLLQTWIDRHRQRKALGDLAAMNGHLLQDIGVSQAAALREAAKPFWRD
jgi:uncharacterized protein YjiS (DUF1127 family)